MEETGERGVETAEKESRAGEGCIPLAAVTSHHKLNGFNQDKLIILW